MIVCVCHVTTHQEIAEAIAEGAHSLEEVGRETGAGTGCGSCRSFVHGMLEAAGIVCAGGCAACPGREQAA